MTKKYEQLISKIQALKENPFSNYYLCSYSLSKQEWEQIAEALETIQFLEIIFAVRNRKKN